ncbi:hypothetical protein LCGC14_0538570 [marine sediment metagenome]|uniref:Bacteriophage Mu GpT domain-containing protein n=1 Tax=marine sediment metagenome TaxID=412755 RepID=A0A0F9SBY5_9ZZZZ
MATNAVRDREGLLTAARMSHNNEIIDVAEVLNETKDILADAFVMQANDYTSHVVSRRTALPGSEWVKVGNGWDATSGSLNQVRETIGMVKSRYLCPEDVMRIQPNKDKFRSQQERAHIEGMGQEVANTLMGNWSAGNLTQDPSEEFAGFSLRYPNLGTADSNYVINNGNGSGSDNTSIWFVQWGPGRVFLTYPRHSTQAGLKKDDKGLVYTLGDNASGTAAQRNKQLWAFITEFSWDVGLVIEDTRSVKRLCNIDSVSTETNTLDYDKIIQIRNNFRGNDTIFMYVNETVFTQLDILAVDKTNVHYVPDGPFGKSQLFFRDMPVRRCDAITDVEAVIT